jgi:YidC/Oxa1 family membrane protein insertase
MKAEQARQAQLAHQEKKQPLSATPGVPGVAAPQTKLSRLAALKEGGQRIAIDTPTLDGSLLLRGARFDDLRLKKFREKVDPKSPEIVLLAPKGYGFPYYADFDWVTAAGVPVPDDTTPWKLVGGSVLAPGKPITLEWQNGKGLSFTRRISVDDKYMFAVADTVRNSGARLALFPYASVVREGVPKGQHYLALHEGFVGWNGSLQDAEYEPCSFFGRIFGCTSAPQDFTSADGGWVGITDKYWMAAAIPSSSYTGKFRASALGDSKAFQASYQLDAVNLAPGEARTVEQRLFAGAKVVGILRDYEKNQGVHGFDYAIDWGWFWFFTRPLFAVLEWFFHLLGNFGLAILALTVVIKAVTFPIANASAKTMAKMKKVQPEMERIKERFKDDAVKQQQEVMELYKREKVNPLTGCLPQFLVIPVFFSLYKVFIVTIEMYHAPFYGWIRDLSAPDPSSILNLFGLLPYQVTLTGTFAFLGFLSIGAWPILMGFTQWMMTKLNPPAPDPVQQRMFSLMPIMFTFMFSTLPSGLVIYYAWNNLLTIAQQMFIMRQQNVPIHLIDNFKLPRPLQQAFDSTKKLFVREQGPQAGE